MSSATAPARATSSRRVRPAPVAGSRRFDSPGHDLLPARLRHGGPRRLRADHGAVRLVDRLHRLVATRSPYSIFLKQAAVRRRRAVALVVASRMPVTAWKRLALPILAVGVRAAAARAHPARARPSTATRTGSSSGRSAVQPSEIVKLGLVLAGGLILAAKRKPLHSLSHVARALPVPVAAVSIGAVVLGHDLGTVLILGAIVAGVLFAAGIPLRWFAFAGLPFAAMAVAFIVTEPQPAGPLRRLARPRHQRVRRRAPADPRPLRPRRRRLVRPRPRRQPREVGPALRAAQRLHLRDHRRGARAARHPRGPPALRRPGPGLLPPRHAHRRLLRPHRHGRRS